MKCVSFVLKWVWKYFVLFLTSPVARLLIAAAIAVILGLGSLAEKGHQSVVGILPAWFAAGYTTLAAVLAAQPFFGGLTEALTRRRLNSHLRDGLDTALRDLVERIHDIARIGPNGKWTPEDARAFERQVVQSIQRLLVSAGMSKPRVCFYTSSNTDNTDLASDDDPRVEVLEYAYHYPGDDPSERFIRSVTEGTENKAESASGLFETLDTRKPTRELDRPGFDPEVHHWRSSLRVAIKHEKDVWGVMTVDSMKKNGTKSNYENILGFGAGMVAVARRCEDTETSVQETVSHMRNAFNRAVSASTRAL